MMAPTIIRDTREDSQFDGYFKAKGATLTVSQLAVGDFICSERIGVERKTREDFEQSIVDGRLFTQIQNLAANYSRPVLIVEGQSNADRLHQNALLGAYASLISDLGATLFFTKTMEKTAELIFHLAHHEQCTHKRPVSVFSKRKTHTLSQTARAVIETFPLMGPTYSQKLLTHFGSLARIAGANEEELSLVIGPKRAKIIHNLFKYEYENSDDESAMR